MSRKKNELTGCGILICIAFATVQWAIESGIIYPIAIIIAVALFCYILWEISISLNYDAKKRNTLKNFDKYYDVLETKFMQLTYTDDYGILQTNAFERELDYFINNVLSAGDLFSRNEKHKIKQDIISRLQNRIKTKSFNNKINLYDTYDPYDFERKCAKILKENGWIAQATKKSSDQGVDVIAEKNNIKVVLQCKLYSSPVGNKAVQEVFSGKNFYKADYAAVVTNSDYTTSARQLAKNCNVLLLHTNDLNYLDKHLFAK